LEEYSFGLNTQSYCHIKAANGVQKMVERESSIILYPNVLWQLRQVFLTPNWHQLVVE
jgi:hypothetical protein